MEEEKLLIGTITLQKLTAVCLGFLTTLLIGTKTMADNKKYTISKRADGGYTISITYSKRIWKPITAEGFFPKETGDYEINIIGSGEDWSYQGEPGFFYSLEKIKSKKTHWETGFAWVDQKREYLYLNLYWVSVPDKLMPLPINGKYKIYDAVQK